ncbi:hypothetical protein QBC36DRAFT_305710 [Triangularia setosa]|uniref:Uncharacterized protein n=1 Tax=Triangularia setosa TaxID=2587417 RepID=A0AAN7A1R0_9PEZI|nr:hypothetical protein QBC36DRAFT_305710 [Podospora setosa]
MKSSDVRDMELGQWTYWATALPVTIFVISLGLWWTGDTGNVMRAVVEWVRGLGYRRGWRERGEDMVPMVAYGETVETTEWREKRYVVEGARKRR